MSSRIRNTAPVFCFTYSRGLRGVPGVDCQLTPFVDSSFRGLGAEQFRMPTSLFARKRDDYFRALDLTIATSSVFLISSALFLAAATIS